MSVWRRPDVRWTVGLTLVALAVRVVFVLLIDRPKLAFDDMLFYDMAASSLAAGKGFAIFGDQVTVGWPPAFPFLLSLVYRVFGSDYANAEGLNAALGALTVPLVYLAALRAFGRREAIVASALLAIFPGQILFAPSVLAEPLYTFLLAAVLAALVWLGPSRRAALGVGVLVGLSALTRGEGLFLVLLPLIAWWGTGTRREVASRFAVMAVAAAIVVVPWTARNAFAVDSFVPVSTNSGQTLWSGHNPTADGGATYPGPGILAETKGLVGAEREVEQSKLLRREAISWAAHNPLRELTLIPRKLVYLNLGDSRAVQRRTPPARGRASTDGRETTGVTPVEVSSQSRAVLIGIVADVFYYALLALFVASLLLLWPVLWRNPLGRAGIGLTALALVLYGLVLYGNFRYRMPLEIVMIMLASPLTVRVWDARRTLQGA